MNSITFLRLALLFTVATQIDGQIYQTVVRKDIKGRLLTPEEGCGYSKVANTRIVGGAPAKIGAWPWLVLLARKVGYTTHFNCVGSLITSKHVLTAAHCLPKATFARLGEHNTNSFANGEHEDIIIAQKIAHEKWSPYYFINDIAILILARDVTFNDRISPICLPDNGAILTKSFVGQNPFVAGWGRLQENGFAATELQQIQLPVISNTECKEKYKKLGRLKDDIQFSDVVLCAGFTAGGRDSCQGDSGGPMMLPEHKNGKFPFYQIGIVSWGLGCGRPNVPGVYTNVRHYMDWIQSKLLL